MSSVKELEINNTVYDIKGKTVVDNNSGELSFWSGSKAQYDAIVIKDANTLYNITDDTDVSLTILEALYPVGSIYITTNAACPLSTLIAGSNWSLVGTGVVTGIASTAPCKGNGMTLGTTDGTHLGALGNNSGLQYFGSTAGYGQNVGYTVNNTSQTAGKTVGITTDATKSGIVADTSGLATTLAVNIFRRIL